MAENRLVLRLYQCVSGLLYTTGVYVMPPLSSVPQTQVGAMKHGTLSQHPLATGTYAKPANLYLNHVKHELSNQARRMARLKKQLQGYRAMLGAFEDALDREADDLNALIAELKRTGATNGVASHKGMNGRAPTP